MYGKDAMQEVGVLDQTEMLIFNLCRASTKVAA
jgi:hypothetical protein